MTGRYHAPFAADGSHGIDADVANRLLRIAMSQTNGHRQEAAKLLGWGRNTLTRKIKEDLEAAGCSIPFPQTDVHLHQVTGSGAA